MIKCMHACLVTVRLNRASHASECMPVCAVVGILSCTHLLEGVDRYVQMEHVATAPALVTVGVARICMA